MMDSKSDAELVSEADEIAVRQYGKSVRGQYAALCSVGLIVAPTVRGGRRERQWEKFVC